VHQLTLLGLEPTPLPDLREAVAELPTPAAPSDDQLELFEDRTVLAREMEAALYAGDLEASASLRARLEEAYGPSAATARLAFVDTLPAAAEDPQALLGELVRLDGQLRGPLREGARSGLVAALLRDRQPADLVSLDPACLPVLVNALGDDERGRRLVRDALLAGGELPPVEFEDEAVREVLGEDLAPRWLASLGAIRRLWPAGEPSLREPAAEPDEPALAFWAWLSVACAPGCPEQRLHEARRQMKRLHPALHAEAMRLRVR
jgi:hypothetical protein